MEKKWLKKPSDAQFRKMRKEEEETQAKDKGMQLSYLCHLSMSSMIIYDHIMKQVV